MGGQQSKCVACCGDKDESGKDVSIQPLDGTGLAGTEEVTETKNVDGLSAERLEPFPEDEMWDSTDPENDGEDSNSEGYRSESSFEDDFHFPSYEFLGSMFFSSRMLGDALNAIAVRQRLDTGPPVLVCERRSHNSPETLLGRPCHVDVNLNYFPGPGIATIQAIPETRDAWYNEGNGRKRCDQ
eukprot:g9283.t1